MTGKKLLIGFGAVGAGVAGVGFFNLIVGVFGLTASITALAVFILLAVVMSRTPQPEED